MRAALNSAIYKLHCVCLIFDPGGPVRFGRWPGLSAAKPHIGVSPHGPLALIGDVNASLRSRPQTAEKRHAASPFHPGRTASRSHCVFRSRDQRKSLSASAGQRKRRLAPESPLGRHRIGSERLSQFAAITVEVSLRFSWGAGVFKPVGPF